MRREEPIADPVLWELDPGIDFLNHGSFGACPKIILDKQREYQDAIEHQPMSFLVDDLEPKLDEARNALAKVINANPEDLVFVPNITHGVNTVLRSLTFQPGDELITTMGLGGKAGLAPDHVGADALLGPVENQRVEPGVVHLDMSSFLGNSARY